MPALSEILGINTATVHPSSRVAQALARAGVPKTPELLRVINLPRRIFDPKNYPDSSILYTKKSCNRLNCRYCKDNGPKLRPIQNAIIIESAQNSGSFCSVGVGEGKTLASFLLHDALEARVTVLLVPPSLRDKTLNIDLPELDMHFVLPKIFRAEDYKGQTGVYVLGYSEISQTNASDLLDKIKPDLIIADEVQALSRKESARTRRFLRFMRKNPCKFVAMTGSPLKKTIKDFAHLIELALGKNSPLPADFPSLTSWADAIDNEGKPGATEIGALSLMCEDHESAREGFRRRLSETPGVIVTTEVSCNIPLEIREFTIAPPVSIQKALQDLENSWAWDNTDYNNIIDIARLQKQLTQGYFYRYVWPNGIPDRLWLDHKNAWSRAIRGRLKSQNRVGQDSPALLEAMAERGEWLCSEWTDWQAVKDRPEPKREAVEVDRWLANLGLAWALNISSPGIIWVNNPVVGQWLQDLGIDYYGEGQDKELNQRASNCLAGLEQTKTIACSVYAHGTGKNLQAWCHNLVLYPMSQGALWEQVIGRTHRPGQIMPKVSFDIVLGSESAIKAMQTAYEDSERIQELTGTQRLQLATRVELNSWPY